MTKEELIFMLGVYLAFFAGYWIGRKHENEKSWINAHKDAENQLEEKDKRIAELEVQLEKMKKYGKLLQDICVVLGNDNFMVAVQLESVVKKLWDTSEEKEGLKMVEDIENRLLKIKPQEWAEITKWEK